MRTILILSTGLAGFAIPSDTEMTTFVLDVSAIGPKARIGAGNLTGDAFDISVGGAI